MNAIPAAAARAQEPAADPTPSIADLHDLVLPEPVSWMPATTAWLALAVLLAALLLFAAWRAWRRWSTNAYRRAALAELTALRGDASRHGVSGSGAARVPATVGRVSELLKRTALAAYARDRVAPLTGAPWAEFLNASCAGAPFAGDAARALRELEYAPDGDGSPATEALFAAASRWIRGHRPGVA